MQRRYNLFTHVLIVGFAALLLGPIVYMVDRAHALPVTPGFTYTSDTNNRFTITQTNLNLLGIPTVDGSLVNVLSDGASAPNASMTVSNQTLTGQSIFAPIVLSVTNNQVLALDRGIFLIDSHGQATGLTNTVTILGTTNVGAFAMLIIESTATNALRIVPAANFRSATIALRTNDVATLYQVATNSWIATSILNN